MPPITTSTPAVKISTTVTPAVNNSNFKTIHENTFKGQSPPKAQSLVQKAKEDVKGEKGGLDTLKNVESLEKVKENADKIKNTPQNEEKIEELQSDMGKNESDDNEKGVLPKRQSLEKIKQNANDESDLANVNDNSKKETHS